MKKLLVAFSLALLFGVGVAFATGIPQVVDPKNYPVVWTETVYNGTSSAIATGQVVQWDFDTSDPSGTDYDDMTPYVKEVDAAEDIWTAGVTDIGVGIAALSEGVIIIKGPAFVQRGTATTVNQLVGAEADGEVTDFAGGADDECTVGRTIKDGIRGDYSLIYIDPVCYDEN